MSTAATSPAGHETSGDHEPVATPSPAAHRAIPFARLVAVELRKLVDTRGAWILHAVIAALVVGVVALTFSLLPEMTFEAARQIGELPLSLLLPIVGILVATGEWTHRSAMVTFSLEPRRHRVIAAKLVVTVLAALAHLAFAWLLAAVVTAVGGAPQGAWETSANALGGTVLYFLAVTLGGFALGLVVGARTAAIVIYFVLPILMQVLAAWQVSAPAIPWISTEAAYGPLRQGMELMTATEWQHVGVAFGIWAVLLGAVGFWINGRREIK